MISTKTIIKALSITALLSGTASQLSAQESNMLTASETIEARQEIMKGYKSWDKKLSNAYKAETLDTQVLADAALFFKENSGEMLLELFPEIETPEGVKTKAKSAIWRSFDEFTAISLDVNKAANEAYAFTEEGDFESAKDAMKPVVNSCRACHKKYKGR